MLKQVGIVDENNNNDATAHPDIRVLLSNLHEFAHKVASVWSTEVLFEEFTSGNSAELANEGIVTGKWTPEVVQFNS